MRKRNKRGLKWLLSALLGFVCALVLGALFYAAMVYQLTGGEDGISHSAVASALPGQDGNAQGRIPGALLSLSAALETEKTLDVEVGAAVCRVIKRTYLLEGGLQAKAISASPAQYMERLAHEGWTPQLITGFTLAGFDAVLERRGEESLLAARSGETVYLLEVKADDQTLYTLGAEAWLE